MEPEEAPTTVRIKPALHAKDDPRRLIVAAQLAAAETTVGSVNNLTPLDLLHCLRRADNLIQLADQEPVIPINPSHLREQPDL